MKKVSTILLLLSFLFVQGQTGNFTTLGLYYSMHFDENQNLKFSQIPNMNNGGGHTISNYSGNHIISAGLNININEFQLLNQDRLGRQYVTNRIIKLNNGSFLLTTRLGGTTAKPNAGGKAYTTLINRSGQNLTIDDSHNLKILYNDTIYGMEVVSDTTDGTWLILRIGAQKFMSYLFEDSPVPVDSVVSIVPIVTPSGFDTSGFTTTHTTETSPSGNYLCVRSQCLTTLPNGIPLTRYHSSDILYFDKATGLLSFKENIFQHLDTGLYSPTVISKLHSKFGFEFSSNDSFFYYSYQYLLPGNRRYSILKRHNLSSSETTTLDSFQCFISGAPIRISGIFDIKLFNNREILTLRTEQGDSNNDFYVFDIIEYSNSSLGTFKKNKYRFPVQRYRSVTSPFNKSKYNYISLKPKIVYSCKAEITFDDQSDYSLQNTTVTYYSEDSAGSSILIPRGANPIITYTKNGDYLFKAILKSHEGTYKEIHYDTLKVRIPEKPISYFETQDTIICAYAPLTFSNLSSAQQTHPSKNPKWVWSFGDGTTITLDTFSSTIEHTYTEPGTYSVSLFYSNGYCDSTLVRNQYIRVVDAPKPGFQIDNTVGCAPLLTAITDTVTVNTTKKEYYYSDIDSLITLPISQSIQSHTFTEAGSFWVVQKLTGYTGCVTRQDSVRINVSPGLTTSDSVHLTNGSFQNALRNGGDFSISNTTGWDKKNTITLSWNSLPAAVSYDILRDNRKIDEVLLKTNNIEQLQYIDSLDSKIIKPVRYSIQAKDSCGTTSSIGRISQPVSVTAEASENNEFSIISYTPYEGWLTPKDDIDYIVEFENAGSWIPLTTQSSLFSYQDFAFLDTEKKEISLEKCYRIIAENNAGIQSISNVICVPYEPIIFIPNSFTPNDDNLNDVFTITTFGIATYTIEIYDSYGGKVTEFNQTNPGWNGKDYPTGTYMVIISTKDSKNNFQLHKRTLHLIR